MRKRLGQRRVLLPAPVEAVPFIQVGVFKQVGERIAHRDLFRRIKGRDERRGVGPIQVVGVLPVEEQLLAVIRLGNPQGAVDRVVSAEVVAPGFVGDGLEGCGSVRGGHVRNQSRAAVLEGAAQPDHVHDVGEETLAVVFERGFPSVWIFHLRDVSG